MQPAVLTTMDITTDGFGFMLSVGNLLWVPMTYSIQARYLASFPKDLGFLGTFGVLVVNSVGYFIFRSANLQKNSLRNNKPTSSFLFLFFGVNDLTISTC